MSIRSGKVKLSVKSERQEVYRVGNVSLQRAVFRLEASKDEDAPVLHVKARPLPRVPDRRTGATQRGLLSKIAEFVRKLIGLGT